MSAACDDLVTRNDAVVHLHFVVRRCGEDPAKILDLSCEAIWTSARVLNVAFRKELREGTRVVRIYRRHILVEKRRPDRF
jgi:hypothetical protein